MPLRLKSSQLTLAAVCFTLCFISSANAKSEEVVETPEEATCAVVVDTSTTDTLLRSTIFLKKRDEAAKILQTNQFYGISGGLTYTRDQTCLVIQTKLRENDPDIVAIQALAIAAQNGGNTALLARAVVESFEIDCKCSRYNTTEKDILATKIEVVLNDPIERRNILNFSGEDDPEVTELPERNTDIVQFTLGRRLLATESSPTNSFYCAYCDPPNVCRRSGLSWCT